MKLLKFRGSTWDVVLLVVHRKLVYEVEYKIRDTVNTNILWIIRQVIQTIGNRG